ELRASGAPLMEGGDDDAGDDDDPDDDTPPADDDEGKTFDLAYVKRLRAEAARHRREARELQAKLKEHEDAGKSETERLNERATTAEQKAAAAEREAARLKVALKKGLTEAQAKRLVGDTEEEMEADADDLLASFKPSDEPDTGDDQDSTGTPRERLKPGAVPKAEPEESDPAKLAERVPRPYN